VKDEPENKYANGFSETERLERMKEDDRLFEARLAQDKEPSWRPKDLDKTESLHDVMRAEGI